MVLASAPPPPQSLYCISWKKPKSPQGTGGGSGLRRTSQAKGGGRPGNPWPLTLDPAAPASPRGGRISLWGMWRSLSFLKGTSASLGEGLGFGWSPQELRSPLRAPGSSPAALAGPRPSCSLLLPPHLPETWWRRRSPRGSALGAQRPPTWARPSVQLPLRAGGGASRPAPPFLSSPPFRFRLERGGTGRAGSALAPPLLLRPKPRRAPPICTLRRSAQISGGGGGAASAVGHMSPRCAGSASSRPSWGRGRI